MIEITLTSYIAITGLPPPTTNKIKDMVTLVNPAHAKAEKAGRNTWNIPREIEYYTSEPGIITIPRGCMFDVLTLLKKEGLQYKIFDGRKTNPIEIESKIKLREYQPEAVEAVLKKDFGTLQAPTGSGKTTMAIELICLRKQRTLILVHSSSLLTQWKERLLEFTNLDESDVAIADKGKWDTERSPAKVTVALINTANKFLVKNDEKYLQELFGYVLIDECHRVVGNNFQAVLNRLNSKYTTGLTATPYRSDGLNKAIQFYCGRIVHKVESKILFEQGAIILPEMRVFHTGFKYNYKSSEDYSKLLSAISVSDERADLVCGKVSEDIDAESDLAKLVVSDRIAHCQLLFEKLQSKNKAHIRPVLLLGKMKSDERKDALEGIESGEYNILIATNQLVGEGFDCKKLSSVFLTTPMSFSAKFLQTIGRVMRSMEGKEKAFIYDFLDDVGVLKASHCKRLRAYNLLKG